MTWKRWNNNQPGETGYGQGYGPFHWSHSLGGYYSFGIRRLFRVSGGWSRMEVDIGDYGWLRLKLALESYPVARLARWIKGTPPAVVVSGDDGLESITGTSEQIIEEFRKDLDS